MPGGDATKGRRCSRVAHTTFGLRSWLVSSANVRCESHTGPRVLPVFLSVPTTALRRAAARGECRNGNTSASQERHIVPRKTQPHDDSRCRPCGARSGEPRRIAAILAGMAMMFATDAAMAQDRPGAARPSALGAATVPVPGSAPRLQVPSVVIGAPASETSLGISLVSDGALPSNSYVRIRGLNPQMALTAGHVIAPGAWAVPVAALTDLRLIIPAGAAGKSDVGIALVAIDGGVIAEARTAVVVAGAALGSLVAPQPGSPTATPPSQAAGPGEAARPPVTAPLPPQSTERAARPAAPAVAVLPPVAQPAPSRPPAARRDAPSSLPAMSPADRSRAEGHLSRGRSLLQSGDIASARLFFRRAAEAGLAEAALAMGDTFDPVGLDRLRAVGVQPDPAEARLWYEKARSLGAGTPADRRLERLGRR